MLRYGSRRVSPRLRVLLLATAWGAVCPVALLRGQETKPAGEPLATLADRLVQAEAASSQKGDFKAALALLPPIVEECERLGDERSLLRALRALAVTHWGLGHYAEALARYQYVLAVARTVGDGEAEAAALNNIGLDLYSLGRYAEALETYDQAIEVSERHGIARIQATALANRGLVHHYQGRYAEAIRGFEEALRIHRGIGFAIGVGQDLNHLGMTSLARGEYQRALAYHAEALETRRQAGDRQGEAQSLHNTANVYGALGQRERAIELYSEAQAIAEGIGYRNQIGYSHREIGNVLAEAGRPREALARFEAALALWQEMDRRGAMMEAIINVGSLRLGLDADEAAREAGNRALALARELKDTSGETQALELLGRVELKQGDAKAALVLFDGGLEVAHRTGTADLERSLRHDRGLALRAAGRPAEAIEELRASAGIVNDLRANVGSDPGKIGFMDERQLVFHSLVEALSAAGRHGEALEAAEGARARALADLLGHRQRVGRTHERAALAELNDRLEEHRGVSRARAKDASDSSSGDLAKKRSGKAVDDALARLRTQSAEMASLVAVESPGLAEIRGTAGRLPATLVEYLVTERRLFLWVVEPTGALHAASVAVTADELEWRTRELRGAIDETRLEGRADTPALSDRLRGLHRLLIEPVSAWLPRSAEDLVVLVPHGPLALLPFAALQDASGHPLVDGHTIAYAPAISVFRYTASKAEAPQGGPLRALVVTDPVPPAGSGLGRLAGAADEGRRVRRHLAGSTVQVLAGEEATEVAVKRWSPGRAILHFATHGVISAERPLDSALVLGQSEGEDGYLRVEEIFALELDADLVVASGCSTGVGRLSGDGVLGLTRAFIYAGTPSVLVSQWDVSDRATAFLMDRFYAELAAGRGKARALRAAQRATRARFSHPGLWAAFVLVGEPS